MTKHLQQPQQVFTEATASKLVLVRTDTAAILVSRLADVAALAAATAIVLTEASRFVFVKTDTAAIRSFNVADVLANVELTPAILVSSVPDKAVIKLVLAAILLCLQKLKLILLQS